MKTRVFENKARLLGNNDGGVLKFFVMLSLILTFKLKFEK